VIKPADLRLLGIAVVLFGLAWPITKHAMQDATPLWFAVTRSLGAAAMSVVVLALWRRLVWPVRRDWPTILGVGFFQLAVFFALAHLALNLTGAGRTAVLANVITPWLVPLSVLLLHEQVSPQRWFAAGLGVAGVVALAGPWAVDWTSAAALLGNAMLVGAALSWTTAILITRLHPPAHPTVSLLPWCFAVSALCLVPLALWREPDGGIGPGAYWQAAWIGLVAAPVGTWAVIEVGRRLPSTIASAGMLLVPAVGVAAAAIWLAEPIGWDIVIGGVLIGAGVLVAARS